MSSCQTRDETVWKNIDAKQHNKKKARAPKMLVAVFGTVTGVTDSTVVVPSVA